MERTRFCQRCAAPQTLANSDLPNPCARCGGTNFDFQPKRHAAGGSALVAWFKPSLGIASDHDFLRVQGIDPEND